MQFRNSTWNLTQCLFETGVKTRPSNILVKYGANLSYLFQTWRIHNYMICIKQVQQRRYFLVLVILYFLFYYRFQIEPFNPRGSINRCWLRLYFQVKCWQDALVAFLTGTESFKWWLEHSYNSTKHSLTVKVTFYIYTT